MPPTADEQIKFIVNIQRLLDEGAFVASYKYALLLALADLAVEYGDESGRRADADDQADRREVHKVLLAAKRCRNRTFPKLEHDTPVTVRGVGQVHVATLRQAKAWAARWCRNREQREAEWKQRAGR
jgi:hypothetical protein